MATYNLGAQVRAIAEKTNIRLEDAVRKTVIDLSSRMIGRSPVDTGRFRANWQFGSGAANTSTGNAPGGNPAGAIESSVAGAPIGGTWVVSNSLPYAQRLEHGWSQQAPAGMVKVTIAEFQSLFSSAWRGS